MISNYTELINKLANLMNINKVQLEFQEIENKVWDEIFSKKTLLVLDNLETEIVRSNLSEFVNVANKFIRKFDKPSRLIITSRYGLGDSENKLPLYQFNKERTQELMTNYMNGQALKNRTLSTEDWAWVHSYTQGNPGLIIALCHTFSSTRKSILDLRVEYESEYTKESTQLHTQLDEFLGFCFENTIESMSEQSQIFLSILCYICSEANITEVNEELLSFLREELSHQILDEINVRASNYVNIGFLQPIPNSDRYYANELVIDYMNGNYSDSDQVFNVFKLKECEWFRDIEKIKALINEIQFNQEISLGKLISELYLSKYKLNNDPQFLLKSFYCYPTLDSLFQFFKKADETKVVNHINLLEKVNSQLKDRREYNKQHAIVFEVVNALIRINQKILRREITNIKQYELFAFFNQLQEKIAVLKDKELEMPLRKQICKLLISLKKFDLAEGYLADDDRMTEVRFDIYVKQVMELGNKNQEKCSIYIQKCTSLLSTHASKIKGTQRAQFCIYAARFFVKDEPEKVLKLLENYEQFPINNGMSMYCFYLESLLLRARCTVSSRGSIDIAKGYIERFKRLSRTSNYDKIYHQKKESLSSDLKHVQRMISIAQKKAQ